MARRYMQFKLLCDHALQIFNGASPLAFPDRGMNIKAVFVEQWIHMKAHLGVCDRQDKVQ